MNLAISLSAGIVVPRVSAKTFVRMSRQEQKEYLEAYPQSSHQYLNSQPPGVMNLADRLDTDPRKVAECLREPSTNRLLGACGKGFGTLFNTIDQVLKMPNKGLMKGFESLHKTKAFQALHKGTIKVDKFLEKNPVLKKAGGPLVAGALAYQWLNMSFSGDFDDDFNIEDLTSALQGDYSIEQLLGTPAGLKGCAQLVTGLVTGGLLSFPWHSKMNIAFAAAYTGARKLGKSDVAKKMFARWSANPDKGRKTLEAKAGTMKIQIPSQSKTVKIRITPRKQSGVVPYKMTKMLEPKFLLVRKTGSGKWGFPKGKIEAGMTPKKSALVEAWEEAGVKGKVVGNVGRYSYIKNKTSRVQNVDLFLMVVTKQTNNYLETERERKWFTYSQAMKVLQKTQMPFLRIARLMIEEQTGI